MNPIHLDPESTRFYYSSFDPDRESGQNFRVSRNLVCIFDAISHAMPLPLYSSNLCHRLCHRHPAEQFMRTVATKH